MKPFPTEKPYSFSKMTSCLAQESDKKAQDMAVSVQTPNKPHDMSCSDRFTGDKGYAAKSALIQLPFFIILFAFGATFEAWALAGVAAVYMVIYTYFILVVLRTGTAKQYKAMHWTVKLIICLKARKLFVMLFVFRCSNLCHCPWPYCVY